MGLQDFINKRMEKTAEKRAKQEMDKVMGVESSGADTDNEGGDEDDESKPKRGRGLLRRIRSVARRSTTSPESNDEDAKKKRSKKKKSRKKDSSKASTAGSSTSRASVVSDGGVSDGSSGRPSMSDTETPVDTAGSRSSDTDVSAGNRAASRAGSDWQTNSTASDQSDVEVERKKSMEREEQRMRETGPPDSRMDFNPKARAEFTVRVRVIEAKELQGDNLNPLVRVNLAGKTRTTRSIKGTDRPVWNQTLSFTLKTCIEDLSALTCEFNVYSARRLIRDSLIGCFNMNMGVVFKSRNQAIVERWLALMPSNADDENGTTSATEIRGFLKISICVYHANQMPPSLYSRGGAGDGEDDVFFRAQLLNYCLRFRIYKVCQLADHICYPYKSAPQAPGDIAVEVNVGPFHVMSTFAKATDETISFGEELQVPIMWPTVIKQIRFRLIALNPRKKKRVLCTEFVNMRDVCQPGEGGFLPAFGPAYVSFYGPENRRQTWKPWEKNQVKDGKYPGSHYLGRLYFELNCEESTVNKTHVINIPTAIVQNAENFYHQERYTLFCSFLAANLIHSDFKSKDIQFLVSIGEHGSADYGNALTCTNRTLPVMPSYDTTQLYTMPWGNQKPTCEILCDWEDISWRFEVTNILNKIADLLLEFQEDASIMAGSNPEKSELASLVVEAIEEAADCFATLRKLVNRHMRSGFALTALDHLLQDVRRESLYKFFKQFGDFKFQKFDLQEMEDMATAQLGVFANLLRDLASDPQLSIPDMCVHMIVGGKVVGYARVPVNEIYHSRDSFRTGRYAGKIQAIQLNWPTAQMSKFRGHELPGVLHVKAWFGKTRHRGAWLELIRPAFLRYYAELFYNERRGLFSDNWKPTEKKPFTISDASGVIELSESAIHPPAGWRFADSWVPKRCHDMWVGEDAGHTSFEDEFFEVQKKDPITQEWREHAVTGFFGDVLDRQSLRVAPPGWTYVTGWNIDFHGAGDADGWLYAIDDVFWEADASAGGPGLDAVERQSHKFRRRRNVRRRRFATDAVGITEMFEDLREFAKNLDEEGWEYGAKFGEPVHILEKPGDRFRRRRLVRQLIPLDEKQPYKLEMGVEPSAAPEGGTEAQPQLLSPRIYEVHEQVSVFELRVYILWAREVHSPKKHLSRAFVRVYFLNRCQQTHIIQNSLNPIWNETLLYSRILIPGGTLALQRNPPSAVVEVHGEEINGKPVFLGRFVSAPVVINSNTDPRSKPVWHALKFANQRSKGALLMHMELFQSDPTMRHIVPPTPADKINLENRLEVPVDCRPAFSNFTVQIMAWGVRNLARHQLLSVRSPFIQFTVASRQDRTDTIDDTSLNPNFDRPLLTFLDVQMPTVLGYAPPIVMNLHDQRSFGRRPLIGTCVVKRFQRYMTAPPPARDVKRIEEEWETFDIEMAIEYKDQLLSTKLLRQAEPEEYQANPGDPNSPRIDWWSKYYFSKGLPSKAPGYGDLGLEKMQIYKCPLEDVGEYRGFEDFLDTFVFTKPFGQKLDKDLAVNAEKKGELKGKLFITQHDGKKPALLGPPGVEFDGPVECVVRVYIVGAAELVSRRRSGLCDPYINVRCGNKKKYKGKKEYHADTTEPVFGQCIEMEVTIPQEKDLVVSVMDRRLIISDDEIGATRIDLENRLLTKYRATVGLPMQYNVIGPLPWRDQLMPLQTLRRYCQKMSLPPPKVLRNQESGDVGLEWVGVEFWAEALDRTRAEKTVKANKNSKDESKPTKPPAADFSGRPIQRCALHILHKVGLVPEHVETRPLYHSVNPEMECGQLEMFVDIFPKVITERIPPALDISPRQPKPFQLRVVVWGLRNVILPKKSMGRPAADLYVRCYLNGMSKSEKTDVHYRCLDGYASFNWRFVFNFDYDVFQRQIRAYRKKRFFRKKSSELVDPYLVIQIWDNNKFSKDKYIGQLIVDLLEFEDGLMDEDEIADVGYEKDPNQGCTCCTVFGSCAKACVRSRCCTRPVKRSKKAPVKMPRAPRFVAGRRGTLSLFQQRSAAGWWPCTATNLPPAQRADQDARTKKHDVPTPDSETGDEVEYVTGMVELELNLMPLEEAEADPSPHLPPPDRPKFDSWWCTSRAKAASRICWHKCGGWSCMWMVCCAVLLTALILSLVYHLPQITGNWVTNVFS